MKIYTNKPITPALRHLKGIKLEWLHHGKPNKNLILAKTTQQGRGDLGRITSRSRGGKGKRLFRNIDLWYGMWGTKGSAGAVLDFFYDPNRTAYLALVVYLNGSLYGQKRYVIATEGLKKGDLIRMGGTVAIETGNALPLAKIPPGTNICCIELTPGRGAQLVRSAGTKAVLLMTDKKFAAIKLPSKEVRLVSKNCFAVVGTVNSSQSNQLTRGKAGRSRWLGRRPKVRGSAMNPIDHPHGGGEGCCPIGRKSPYTPWGKPAFGIKTRNSHRTSRRMILRRGKI